MQEDDGQIVQHNVRVARVAQVPDRLHRRVHRAKLDRGVRKVAPGDAIVRLGAEVVDWNFRIGQDLAGKKI